MDLRQEVGPSVKGSWIEGLNPSQREAACHPGGPLLIVAGAGTGKTMTLASRVAYLVESGVGPERILLLTFTRRAAREMLARASRLSGLDASGRVRGGTFHAVANRLLRLYGRALGLRPDFTVLDQADTADLMNLIRGELRLGQGERRFPRKETLSAIHSRTVNAGEKLAKVIDRSFPWCKEEIEGVRSILRAYTDRKRAHNVLDYDDLLVWWRALLQVPSMGEHVGRIFDHVLVDEYQDTNALQADILAAMWRPGGNLVAVGDDAQAIYSFRSATVRNILDFPTRFPGTTVVKLERNYRSGQPILDVSNGVIALSAERHEKTLSAARPGGERPVLTTCLDEAEECDEVCRAVLEHRERGTPLRRQAVLFRTAHHSDLLEVELSRRNIPFVKYGGLKFLESAHVKDTLAVLRILENPFDEVSWFRVLQLLEGIGPSAARRVMAELGVTEGSAAAGPSPLRRMSDRRPAVPDAAGPELTALSRALADCEAGLDLGPQLERIQRFFEPVFERRYSSPSNRLRDLEQLQVLAATSGSRARFLSDLTLDPPGSTGDLAGPPLLDEDYLILSTIHSAKGCEWDVVHVIHAADGMIPSDMATGESESIEEERRLLYVALTRARDALYVYFPLRSYRRPRGRSDDHAYSQLTRFLPEQVRGLLQQRSSALASMPSALAGSSSGPDGYLRDLWD
jgi:DNA helicase II / ATP-dependent DNA helicase PcrA